MLIDGVSEVSTDNIEQYLDDSPIKFHLFAYLHEIIFKKLELKENKREVLKHRFVYSDKYEKQTKTAIAEKLQVTTGRIYLLEQSLERDIRDVIRVFKVFSPFYSYKSKYLSEKEMVKISPEVSNCIR
jgi:DNA-directed RNA polymerase sigma subunit (sigma70/sigma32)